MMTPSSRGRIERLARLQTVKGDPAIELYALV